MNATRRTEWLMLSATGATFGVLAHEPLAMLAVVATAAIAARRGLPGLAHAGAGIAESLDIGVRTRAQLHVLQAFMSRDAFSPRSSPAPGEDSSETLETLGTKGKEDRERQSFEEFTAGLEEDDEEISFLPPYASDTVPTKTSPASSTAADLRLSSLLIGDLEERGPQPSRMPSARRFALGTVAIIRRLLEPVDVERILVEQRRYPRLRFGDVAVQLSLLSEDEVQELLVAQEQGIFSDEEISDARRRLAAYHDAA